MLDLLNKMHAYRWDVENLDNVLREGLTDAALSGNGIFYSYWDESIAGGNGYVGDIRTETVDSTNVFVSDVNSDDIQSQDYIILSGRTSVYKLRAEAIANGRPADLIEKIVPDDDLESLAGDYSSFENNDLDSEKATYLIKFTKDENGFVSYGKVTDLLVSWHIQQIVLPSITVEEDPFDPYDPGQVDLSGNVNYKEPAPTEATVGAE